MISGDNKKKKRQEDFIIVASERERNEAKSSRLLCGNSEVLLELFRHVENFCRCSRCGEVSIELFPKSGRRAKKKRREHDLRLPSRRCPARTRNDETIVNNALSMRGSCEC